MTDEMILVPRAELLAWAKAWLNDYDPNDGTDCVTPFDTYLLKSPVEAHCTTCSCAPGMTPAVRFDATPAEKEGAVRDHLIRMGWTPPAEAQPASYDRKRIAWELERTAMGDGYYGGALRAAKDFLEATPTVRSLLDRWATGKQSGLSDQTDLCAFALQIYAADGEPPSAPVGVDIPPRKNERGADGKFRTIYLFDSPREQGRFQISVERALAQQPPAEVQPVGEAGSLPGSNGGFTTAVFKASDVPVGAKLYTAPPSAPVGVEAVFNLVRACESAVRRLGWRSDDYTLGHEARMLAKGYEDGAFKDARATLHALAQQPAAVDSQIATLQELVCDLTGNPNFDFSSVDYSGQPGGSDNDR